MAEREDENQQSAVVDGIDDPVVTHADPEISRMPRQRLHRRRPRRVTQELKRGEDPSLGRAIQLAQGARRRR